MSAYLYDTALIQKFNRWTENTNVHLYGPEQTRQLFELIADTNKDKPIALPIITIVRPNGYEIINTNKQPLTYDGRYIPSTSDTESNSSTLQLNGIPIQLNYQINVYARKYREADAYMREIIFNLVNYPKLQITIPYHSSNLVHNCSIEISSTVEDNSAIPERLAIGQFTRLSISISIVDAYLWDTRVRPYLTVDGQLIIESSETDIVTEDLDLAFTEETTT